MEIREKISQKGGREGTAHQNQQSSQYEIEKIDPGPVLKYLIQKLFYRFGRVHVGEPQLDD